MPRDGRMILVVDDEEYVVKLARAVLTRGGFEVIAAQTGMAALHAVKLNVGCIRAVLLDLHLPDVDGISLIPMLREADRDIAIVLTSGYLGENISERFGPQVSFLQKPYNCGELIAAVEAVLTQPKASTRRASFPVRARSAA